MGKSLTKDDFIAKAKKIHGETYKYNNVDYVNSHTKVCIVCTIHGAFWQTPNSHLRGRGCPKCGGTYHYTTEEWVEEAKKVHGNKYDYSKVCYKNNKTKVCIICKTHGAFFMTPNMHIQGCKCPKCAGRHNYMTKEWIEEAKKVHKNKFVYDKVKYINNKTTVCIICKKHGEFWQVPNSHLQGYGCPKCSGKYHYTTEDWINEAKKIHGDKYDYSKVNYIDVKTNVSIICPIHGEFWQNPYVHLKGHQCPRCVHPVIIR